MRGRKRSGPAFTLIELLIVIAIIAILASLTLSAAGFIQKKAGRSRAEAEIAALSAALENYKVDNGDYPTGTNLNASSSAGDNKFLRDALVSTNKVYFEFSKSQTNSSGRVLDPFGNSYGYQYPGDPERNGSNFFDIWSLGGSTGSGATNIEAWIKNW